MGQSALWPGGAGCGRGGGRGGSGSDKASSVDLSNVSYRLFKGGDLLLTEASGSASQVGRSAVWRDEFPVCCFQNTVIRFRPHAVAPEFAHAIFRHYAIEGLFACASRGVGIRHLGGQRFAQLSFPVPPLEEQPRIAEEVQRRTIALKGAESALPSALKHVGDQEREIFAAAVVGHLAEREAAIADREHRTFETASQLVERVQSPALSSHHLRSVLDHIVYQLVIAKTKQPPPFNSSFPIVGKRRMVKKQWRSASGRIRNPNPRAMTAIQRGGFLASG